MEHHMPETEMIALTVTLTNIDGDSESCEATTELVLQGLKANDDVEQADRIVDTDPPEGSKAGAAFIVGLIKAVVNASAIKSILQFLWERAKGHTIEVVIDANGKKLTLTVSNERELRAVFDEVNKFVSG